jgi:hypothetical protein
LRQLPSFRRYVDSLPKKEKAPLLLDDSLFKVSEVSDYKNPWLISIGMFCTQSCDIFIGSDCTTYAFKFWRGSVF